MKQNTKGNRFKPRFHQTKWVQKRPESMLLVGIPSRWDPPTPSLPQLPRQLRSMERALEVLWVLGLGSFLHRGGYPNAREVVPWPSRILGECYPCEQGKRQRKIGGKAGQLVMHLLAKVHGVPGILRKIDMGC
ncbi:hypothetical protein BDV37DRAFT_216271 [Aspergillus pseudonomiae]|uniref:Uncharacterized protein n=1 Tax=Aspergillus pseudonomiae TaxID=1506151 RepID=A0A5N7D0M1_9EURO|nr:uncharacterized protein BDV37DRAFT_216271 [Aspergillus pseudonomiae]KAE8399961.1 hypothetical protein BDV37DRAFT_216271 [Aspergillus pseudonomiae]